MAYYAVPSHDAILVALNDEEIGPSKVATALSYSASHLYKATDAAESVETHLQYRRMRSRKRLSTSKHTDMMIIVSLSLAVALI